MKDKDFKILEPVSIFPTVSDYNATSLNYSLTKTFKAGLLCSSFLTY